MYERARTTMIRGRDISSFSLESQRIPKEGKTLNLQLTLQQNKIKAKKTTKRTDPNKDNRTAGENTKQETKQEIRKTLNAIDRRRFPKFKKCFAKLGSCFWC